MYPKHSFTMLTQKAGGGGCSLACLLHAATYIFGTIMCPVLTVSDQCTRLAELSANGFEVVEDLLKQRVENKKNFDSHYGLKQAFPEKGKSVKTANSCEICNKILRGATTRRYSLVSRTCSNNC